MIETGQERETMATESESPPGLSSQTIAPSQQSAAPRSPAFRIAKRLAIVLWAFCALVLPCFFPFISPEPERWWKSAAFILFVLSWFALYCGLYGAILENAKAGSPHAKFAKGVVIPFLLSMLGYRHDAS